MADLGDTSMAKSSTAGGGQGHKTSSWVVVALVTIASVVLAFAFVLQNIPLAVVGGVVMLAAIVMGIATGIMEDAH